MDTIFPIIAQSIARMEDDELVDRWKREMFSEEAIPIAVAELKRRGVDPDNYKKPIDEAPQEQISGFSSDVTYAGFWPRFAALWLDWLIMSPIFFLFVWGGEHFRLFNVYYFLPGTLFGFFYYVYLVRRFGGTPGKRLMKLRIVKVDGEPVTYREALLRHLPEWVMGIGTSLAGVIAVLSLTDTQYFAAASFFERSQVIAVAMPSWGGPVSNALNVWVWSEFLVMLTNKKRRAIHDFIAGTVVIKDAQSGKRRYLSGAPHTT